MNTKAFLALAATTLALVACAATPSEDPDVDVKADEVDPACIKGGLGCKPPPRFGGSSGLLPPIVVLEPIAPTPQRGPSFFCGGAGPEGGSAEYHVIRNEMTGNQNQCWSIDYGNIEGFPWGYTMLSRYYCPAAYPVQYCDGYGRCSCWSS